MADSNPIQSSTSVTLHHCEGVLSVVLSAPPLNVLDDDVQRQLRRVVELVEGDESIRSVVLTGNERIFAAGADIARLAQMEYPQVVVWNRRLQRLLTSIAELPVPVVAAVRGHALGGGLELALCADYRVAAREVLVGLPEVQLGIMPGAGGTQRLTEIVGRSRAKELILSGRRLGAEEALALGDC